MTRPEDGLDPISLEVYWSRLISIMDEADLTVVRTALSTIVAETRDFAVMLLDANATGIAQSALSLTHFTGMVPRTVRLMLERFPPDTLRDGDVLLTNDPWIGSGHLLDLNVVKPIYYQGRLIGYVGCAAHVSDVGGRNTYMGAQDVYEEGLRLPPCKVYEAGTPNEDVLNILAANVRVPETVLGDIRALLSATSVAERQLRDFLAECGFEDLQLVSEAIQAHSEQAMREVIETLPPGTYRHAIQLDGHADPSRPAAGEPEPHTIAATVTIGDGGIVVDFEGTSPETRNAGVNVPYSYTVAETLNALKAVLVPEIPNNEALFRPVTIRAPEGSLLNCRFPAPTKGRSVTCLHAHGAIYGALSTIIPDRVQAGTGVGLVAIINGQHPDGRPFNAYLSASGGVGALQGRDGLSVAKFPSNTSITPSEIFETHVPLLLTRKELLPDSGGSGRSRGGLSQRLVLRNVGDATVFVTTRPNNRQVPAPGLLGGRPGSLCSLRLNGQLYESPNVTLRPGDELVCDLPGGGGFGDPNERDAERRARDRRLGLTTA
jgi:N-methylhydantoinase B